MLHRGALETSKIQIQDALGPAYEVQTWLDINRSFIGALHIEKKLMMLILSSLLLISGFSITATLVMTVLSDRHDIAIIRSLGFSRAY